MIGSVVEYLKERVGGSKPKVTRQQVLASRPHRNPAIAWEREPDTEAAPGPALLKIPRRRDRFGNLMARIFRLPDFRKLELDEIGSDVWEMCDGKTTVEQVTVAVVTKYRLNRRQAETSVTAYLRMLAQRRLIIIKADKGAAATATMRPTPKRQRRQKKA